MTAVLSIVVLAASAPMWTIPWAIVYDTPTTISGSSAISGAR